MYNYKISEFDLADLMLHKMKNNKLIKRNLNMCTVIFSVLLVTSLMLIFNRIIPEINIIFLVISGIIIGSFLIIAIIKNYRSILARVYRRDVTKESYKYDMTIAIRGRNLMVYGQGEYEEEAYNISDIKCEEVGESTYVVCRGRTVIIPHIIFRSEEEKGDFFKRL